jgi:hypothetical protein
LPRSGSACDEEASSKSRVGVPSTLASCWTDVGEEDLRLASDGEEKAAELHASSSLTKPQYVLVNSWMAATLTQRDTVERNKE